MKLTRLEKEMMIINDCLENHQLALTYEEQLKQDQMRLAQYTITVRGEAETWPVCETCYNRLLNPNSTHFAIED